MKRRPSLSWLWLALALSLPACRRGQVAGTGAECDQRHPCRLGYQCVRAICAPAPEPDPPTPSQGASDAQAGADAPARSNFLTDAEAPSLDAAPDVAASPDLGPAPAPPSLQRCVQYVYNGHPGDCSVPGTGSDPVLGEVVFSRDGRRLATRTSDWVVKTWDVDGDKLTPTGRDFNTGPGLGVALPS